MTIEGVTALIGAGVGIFAAIGSYFKGKYDTEANKSKIAELDAKWNENTKGDSDLKDRVLTLEGEVKYMKGDLAEIKKELKQMMDNQTELSKLMIEVSTNVKALSKNVSELSLSFINYKDETKKDIDKFYQANKNVERPT